MKFSEFPYERPDYPKLMETISQLTERFEKAASASEQIEIIKELEQLRIELTTNVQICTIRYTVDTRDPFYSQEEEYNEQMAPVLDEKRQEFNKALVASPFRKELEKEFGSLMFKNIEISLKSFSPELIPLIQEENQLVQQYQKLCASAKIEFDGKVCNLAQLGPYQQSPDRAVRKAAAQAYGSFFDQHQAQFDDIYDRLVKNRTEQAHRLGLANYVEMAYLLRRRNCYGPQEVANFRRQVIEEIVPVNNEIKRRQAKRIGVEDFQVYDNTYFFPDGNPLPHGTPDELMEAGRRMYTEMSPETAEFIQMMFDHDLFDVLSKEGKAMGGYCTGLGDYEMPFIFANFNGTQHDVEVVTHEAGHAFAAYMNRDRIPYSYVWPSMEACEVHSMSMEFFAWPWADGFFGQDARKFRYSHLAGALTFIPYGTMVDHFQHIVYEKPDMTPEERHAEWKRLAAIYQPWMRLDGEIPFYGAGEYWQRQMHIYQSPFYYIDYCLAQTVSLQFWAMLQKDCADAWAHYMAYTKQGGSRTFTELLNHAGLTTPFEESCLRGVCETAKQWLDGYDLTGLV